MLFDPNPQASHAARNARGAARGRRCALGPTVVVAFLLGGCIDELPPGAQATDAASADAAVADARRPDQAATDTGAEAGPFDQNLPDFSPILDQRVPDDGGGVDARPDARSDADPPDQNLSDASVPDAEFLPDFETLPDFEMVGDAEQDAGVADLGPDEDRCNGIDDDQDGRTDEDHPSLGTLCSVGVGACAQQGVMQCAPNGLGTLCSARAGTPRPEVCGGGDADCNGAVDDVPRAGEPCTTDRLGPCAASGRLVCFGEVMRCDTGLPEVIPEAELCDAIDNDCDGRVDEVVGQPCELGIGACISGGIYTCEDTFSGGPPGCTAVPGPQSAEVCDGIDNDCDGIVDNAMEVGLPCTVGAGACERQGVQECRPILLSAVEDIIAPLEDLGPNDLGPNDLGPHDLGPDSDDGGATDAGPVDPPVGYAITCEGVAGDGFEEICDDVDNDCDGRFDEDPVDVGAPCSLGRGACLRTGVFSCEGARVCDARPAAPVPETCNGIDDDCDGRVDEGDGALAGRSVCGGWVQDHCRVWLGWADNNRNPPDGAETWGGCPLVPSNNDGEVRCTHTRGDGQFHMIRFSGDVDFNDWIGLRFECDEGAVGDWIGRHCEAAFTYSDGDTTPAARSLDPATACGTAAGVDSGNPRCVRSNGDGRFHPLQFQGDVDTNDRLGVAFFCRDPQQAERAAAVAASVEFFLGFWDRGRHGNGNCRNDLVTQLPQWGDCPGSVYDNAAGDRCVGRAGGSGFETILPNVDVEACDYISIGLRRRPDNR